MRSPMELVEHAGSARKARLLPTLRVLSWFSVCVGEGISGPTLRPPPTYADDAPFWTPFSVRNNTYAYQTTFSSPAGATITDHYTINYSLREYTSAYHTLTRTRRIPLCLSLGWQCARSKAVDEHHTLRRIGVAQTHLWRESALAALPSLFEPK